MTAVTHAKVSAKSDGPDSTVIQPSDWNADHTVNWGEDADISTQAFGDAASAGATGEVADAGHKHGFPALGTTPSTQAFGDSAAGGSATTPSKNDHKHAMPTLGYGLSGNSAPAVGLTTAEAFVTGTTSLSAATYADITGASITLAAGTWLILAHVYATDTTTTAGLLVAAITDNSNNLVTEGSQSIPAGTATVSTWGHVSLSAIVSPGSSTTYKLRGARGTTTATATLVVQDGSSQNVSNNASTNTDKATGIRAIRVA